MKATKHVKATPPRAADAPSALNAQRILLDVHAHVIPLRPQDTVRLDGIGWSTAGSLLVDGVEMATRRLYDVDALVAWMDLQRVESAWISIPPTLYRPDLTVDQARQWSDSVNDALLQMTSIHADRLAPLLHLPVQYPGLAADIAERAPAGHRRFAMPAGSARHGVTFSDASYERLWQALDKPGGFLFLHPNRGCDSRFDRFHLHNLLGGPTETALAAAHLAFSGVLERHPDLTVCLAHGGGSAAAVAGRLERGRSTGRTGDVGSSETIGRAFRRLCVDCITHDASALALAAAVHGDDHVLFGSDWPFAMGLDDPHRQLASIERNLRERIFRSNPGRLLGAEADPEPDHGDGK